jgi:hypothetical protein
VVDLYVQPILKGTQQFGAMDDELTKSNYRKELFVGRRSSWSNPWVPAKKKSSLVWQEEEYNKKSSIVL